MIADGSGAIGLGVVVVGTLLAGRLASHRCRTRERRILVWAVASVGILLGFVFYGVDMVDAFAEKDAAEDAAAPSGFAGGSGALVSGRSNR